MVSFQDYKDFCTEQFGCKNCPFTRYHYENCFGFIVDQPKEAERIIKEWKKGTDIFLVIDKYSDAEHAILGIAPSHKAANKMLETIAADSLKKCLAEEDSGVSWKEMSLKEQNDFFNNQIKSTFSIVKKKIGAYEVI